MNKRYHFLFSLICAFSVIIGLLTACSEDSDCSMTARPFMVCNFYKYGANKNIILKDTLKELSIKAIGTDSILINQIENVHSFDSPLRYAKDTTAIILDFHGEEKDNDTIWVLHANTPFFVSIDCGYQMRQNIEKIIEYSKNTLDSVYLRNSEANNYGKENVQLILH